MKQSGTDGKRRKQPETSQTTLDRWEQAGTIKIILSYNMSDQKWKKVEEPGTR